MPASTQAEGLVNTVRGAVRRSAKGALPTVAHLAGRVLTIGDLVLGQLVGVPGTQACCGYLSARWSYRMRRRSHRQRAANPRSQVGPAPATGGRDRERS